MMPFTEAGAVPSHIDLSKEPSKDPVKEHKRTVLHRVWDGLSRI